YERKKRTRERHKRRPKLFPMQYGTTTRTRNPAITKNPSSAFGEGSTGAPCAISRARQITTPIKSATTTKLRPTNERSRRFRPWTISAPQPVQTLALPGTCVWQCGHTKVFTDVQ